MAVRFETKQLSIRELADDVERIFDVYASNPDFLQLTSGAGGEPGLFDRSMLGRDLAVARAMPGRHMAGVYLTATGEPVGALDWMDENPSDGRPWIGSIVVHAQRHRQGIGREAVEGLTARLRDAGAETVRAAVAVRNEPALAFARSLGFDEVSETTRQLATRETLLVFERRLGDPHSG